MRFCVSSVLSSSNDWWQYDASGVELESGVDFKFWRFLCVESIEHFSKVVTLWVSMVTVDQGCDFDSVCISWSGGTLFSRVSHKSMNVGRFLSDRNVDASLYVAFSNSSC